MKAKDLEDKACETHENIVLHQLDEDLEYNGKVDYILENKSYWEILETENLEPAALDCPLCETKTQTEIINIAHMWKEHQAKSTVLLIPKTPP